MLMDPPIGDYRTPSNGIQHEAVCLLPTEIRSLCRQFFDWSNEALLLKQCLCEENGYLGHVQSWRLLAWAWILCEDIFGRISINIQVFVRMVNQSKKIFVVRVAGRQQRHSNHAFFGPY